MQKKIVVVDDNRLVLKFLEKLLTKEGYDVRTAQDGFKALEIIDDFVPDIMFVDLFMPKIDGDKLCQIIRHKKHLDTCYLILFTAAAAEIDLDQDAIGVNACIAKGSFDTMAANVLAALEAAAKPRKASEAIPIIGLETIYARQLTKELLSRKRHLETILESMTEGIIEVYADRVVYANSVAVAMLDKSQQELLYSYPPDLFSGDAHRQIEAALKDGIGSNIEIGRNTPLEINNRKVTVRLIPVKSETATIIMMLFDVTEQKKLEQQLQQAQKMEAIGTLAGGIAHDFNNLLMGIQGNTSLLLMEIEPDAPHYDEIKSIERCVESGARLTRQLLGFARGGKYMVKPTRINEMIRKITRIFERTNKNVRIEHRLEADIWTVEVDQGQIEQVLVNLLMNAWQAMPNGGDIVIATHNMLLDEVFTGRYDASPGRYICIAVTDSGVGIDEEARHRIYEPFFTTKEIGNGSGMGLASAFGIVKNHDGIINFSSHKGKGTTFNVYLPVSARQVAAPMNRAVDLTKGSETILLVDDESIIVEVNQKMLEELGYRVLTADSGREAIETFKQMHDEIDLVFLDIVMPDLNGGDVYDQLKRIKPSVKVLLSSGYSANNQAEPILQRGCNGFLQKPFDIKQMSIKIREILDNVC